MSAAIDWKPLEPYLQKICKSHINLEDTEKRVFTEHFNKVYKHVTDSMGNLDDFFLKVFSRQQLAGSYADRIKVGQPNEYDALMILKFPDPVVVKSKPNFVTINIKDGLKKWADIDESKYKGLIDQNGYLLQDKVLGWLRNLIYEIITKCNGVIRIGNNEYSVKKSSSGPAVTLDVTIMKSDDRVTKGHFSVDFVGALAFDFQEKWFADLKPPFIDSKHWNAIPKPNKSQPNQNREWTCSYADMERGYLHNTQTLKQLIRIFKKIRDTHDLTNLKSYYIKVIFLHQRVKQKNDYWKGQLSALFSNMFDVILDHLEKRQLVSFWHKQYNLFGELTPVQLTDIYNKLKRIKENIDKNLVNKNPEYIYSAILPKKESDMLSTARVNNATTITTPNTCKVVENKSCTLSQRMQNMSIHKL